MTKDEARKELLETLEEYCHDKGYNLQVFAGMADWVYTLYPKEKAMTNADKIRGMTDQNKMEAVAQLFGKKLGERFTVERDHDRFDCEFSLYGFMAHGAYENPYLDFDAFILQDLLVGRAAIVNE
jgi:hypothetical protein